MDLQAVDGGMTIAHAKARLLSCAADEDRRGGRTSVAPLLFGAAALGLVAAGTLMRSKPSVVGRVARLAVAVRLARWALPVVIKVLQKPR